MSANDVRMKIKNLLTGVSATLDDDATAAQIIVVYSGAPENFKQWFFIYDYDAVITIDAGSFRESPSDRRIQWVPLRYNADVGVHVSAVDKATVTATKLINKIQANMISLAEALQSNTTYNIIVQSGRSATQPMGGYDPLWRKDYVFRYRPLSGVI